MRFRGKGALNDVSLIVTIPEEGYEVQKNEKLTGKMIEVQVDQSLMNPEKVEKGEQQKAGMDRYVKTGEAQNIADTNPYLESKTVKVEKGADGKPFEFVTHNSFYSVEQVEDIIKAAGDKKFEADINGKKCSVLGVKANLLFSNGKTVINTKKPMAPTANKQFGKEILAKQEAVTKAAKTFRDKDPEAYKKLMSQESPVKAEAKEVKVNKKEAEMETPEV